MQETENRLDLTDTHTERCKSYECVDLSKATLNTNLIGFIGFRTKAKDFAANQAFSEQDSLIKTRMIGKTYRSSKYQ